MPTSTRPVAATRKTAKKATPVKKTAAAKATVAKLVPPAAKPTKPERTPIADRKAYSLEETAEILDLSLRSVYRLTATGKIRSVKIGGRRLVRAEEIVRLLAEGTEG